MAIEPKACPRPRVTRGGIVYYPKTYTTWRKQAKLLLPITTPPDVLQVVFVFKRPKSLKKGGRIPHTKRPDIDNCIKSLFDLFSFDDAKIHSFTASKVYASDTESACIELEWSLLGENS